MEGYCKQIGEYGEDLAMNFLTKRGYQIIDRNFYTRPGEIDLIAKKGDEFLFIEVKTRTKNNFGYPENAVNYKKLTHLHKAIRIYLDQNNLRTTWHLEIISVEIDKLKKIAKIKRFRVD